MTRPIVTPARTDPPALTTVIAATWALPTWTTRDMTMAVRSRRRQDSVEPAPCGKNNFVTIRTTLVFLGALAVVGAVLLAAQDGAAMTITGAALLGFGGGGLVLTSLAVGAADLQVRDRPPSGPGAGRAAPR